MKGEPLVFFNLCLKGGIFRFEALVGRFQGFEAFFHFKKVEIYLLEVLRDGKLRLAQGQTVFCHFGGSRYARQVTVFLHIFFFSARGIKA